MPELLLEILSEEVPARMQAGAAADLKRLLEGGLAKAGLGFDDVETYVTPRRLCAVVQGLPERTEDVAEERKGPRADAPEKAIEGFKRSLPAGAVVEERETPKGPVLFATIEKPGAPTADVLAQVVPDAFRAVPWPKSMRWADHDLRWVRPIQSLLCLFGGAVVPLRFGPVQAGDITRGHRFLAPEPFTVTGFDDYVKKLHDAKVMLSPDDRAAAIEAGIERLTAKAGLGLSHDTGLLNEVVGLCEWPVVLMGEIDEQFMDLPPEVLTTSMRAHQKYFACLDADGKLAPRFIVAAATEAADGGKAIVAGNERVLRARLADARFFWDTDRAERLETRVTALNDQVFHARLGSVGDKVERMENLAGWLAEHIDGCVPAQAERAAELAKADLTTGMVGEFPELQGVMGRYYARHDKENADVAEAIADHYRPQGPTDAVPDAPVSIAVALADKLDTLVGFWAIEEKPTGSKDPFALRRAALGVIRIVLENELRLDLLTAFGAAKRGFSGAAGKAAAAMDGADLLGFFADRLAVHLRGEGLGHDRIQAAFATPRPGGGTEDDLVRLVARARALDAFLASDDGENLLVAYRRAANILKAEEKKDSRSYDDGVDAGTLADKAEIALNAALDGAEALIAVALKAEDFIGAMAELAKLRVPVDTFFDDVTVNADNAAVRENRLNLLARIRAAVDAVADFSRIEG